MLSGEPSGPHKIQGIGAGFIPKTLDVSILDEIIKVKDEDAIETAKNLAKYEGILCGISSGAAMFGALEVSKRPENKDKIIVVIYRLFTIIRVDYYIIHFIQPFHIIYISLVINTISSYRVQPIFLQC